MKRIRRDPEKFEVIGLFDAIGQKRNFRLNDKNSERAFIGSISAALSRSKDTPIILHGRRVEAMFGHVAASLGQCVAIKQEDSGEVYVTDADVQPPDYRVVLNDGDEFFVEVKNCHKTDPSYKYSIKKSYLNALQKYAKLFNKHVKIAIYWSKWNVWTLISSDILESDGSRYTTTFLQAMKKNEMGTIGDIIIGTIPPLTLRFLTDPTKPRTVVARLREGPEQACPGPHRVGRARGPSRSVR